MGLVFVWLLFVVVISGKNNKMGSHLVAIYLTEISMFYNVAMIRKDNIIMILINKKDDN